MTASTTPLQDPSSPTLNPVLTAENLSVFYRGIPALTGVNLSLYRHQIVGLIGPSGCGKSTLLRCLNRLHETLDGATITGRVRLGDRDLATLHPVEVRRRIGMVFQRPNPFPKSIYENVALGLRTNGYRDDLDDRVETALRQVGLWDEVKQDLRKNAWDLSGGQQQRLCIARAIALDPEAILLDEPCSSLDPISADRVNELLCEMKSRYTLAIVTHDLKQAARVTDWIAFFDVATQEVRSRPSWGWRSWRRRSRSPQVSHRRVGTLVDFAPTLEMFTRPRHRRVRDYLSAGSHRH